MSYGGLIYDQTGLSGHYDFTLDYGKYVDSSDLDRRLNTFLLAIFDAIRAELGLEVVEVKIPVDTLVVDHVEKIPSKN